MSSGTDPWKMFERASRLPNPDEIAAANSAKNQWSISAQGSYSPDDTFFDTQDRHHHSGQINVKFPQNWEPMLQEFIAKSQRFRSQQDLVRTAIVNQMVYEAMREVVLNGTPGFKPAVLISEIIDNQIAGLNALHDSWEKRLHSFDKLCDRLVKASDFDTLEAELAKYDGDIRETDMLPFYHDQFLDIVAKYEAIIKRARTR